MKGFIHMSERVLYNLAPPLCEPRCAIRYTIYVFWIFPIISMDRLPQELCPN
jgi:hypothetical protein